MFSSPLTYEDRGWREYAFIDIILGRCSSMSKLSIDHISKRASSVSEDLEDGHFSRQHTIAVEALMTPWYSSDLRI
jgi:hypothetical protein